jgi:hypothetical protein
MMIHTMSTPEQLAGYDGDPTAGAQELSALETRPSVPGASSLCLVVLGRHVKSLEFFDVLLGDRAALSEVHRFYQRTLANDSDEALAQAEKMLADRSLVDYYDSVVLPALKLAAADAPHATIITGLWLQGESVLHEPQPQKALGADRYVASLREAIDASLAALSAASTAQQPRPSRGG